MPKTIEQKTRLEDRFISAFEMHEGHTLNGTNAVLQGLRKEAIERFAALGFPTRKQEAWKYTNISSELTHDYKVHLGPAETNLTDKDVEPFLIPDLDAHLVVLVNGRFAAELSHVGDLPEGAVVTSLAEAGARHTDLFNKYFARYADHKEEVFTALNTAFTLDGVFVYVPKNAVVEKPIHIVNLLDGEDDLFVQPRNLFVFEQSSQARLIESGHQRSNTRTFKNTVDEVFVGPNARADYYRLQNEGDKAVQVSTTQVYQESDSFFSIHTITLGGALVRNTLNVLPNAENCETHLYGLSLVDGTQHVDNHTLVDHAKPHCYSHELYKAILGGKSTGVFNGKVFVRPDAQQTNAFQENKSILLSDTAKMNAKPELEIYADDVKCSHGATTGQLDPDALFYLRARGLSQERARALLLLAFARDVLDSVRIEPLRAVLDAQIAERL